MLKQELRNRNSVNPANQDRPHGFTGTKARLIMIFNICCCLPLSPVEFREGILHVLGIILHFYSFDKFGLGVVCSYRN